MENCNIYHLNKIKVFSEQILNDLGPAYKEHIYVNAMCFHLRNEKYLFHNEVIVPINYMGVQLGYERADIVIYEPIKCIIEFKSQTQSLSKKEMMQLNKYLKNLNIQYGILINFGNLNGKLEYKSVDSLETDKETGKETYKETKETEKEKSSIIID